MTTIINNTQITLSCEAQQAIRNAMSEIGVEKVSIAKHPNDGGADTLFYVLDENGEVLFSIDTKDCVIF